MTSTAGGTPSEEVRDPFRIGCSHCGRLQGDDFRNFVGMQGSEGLEEVEWPGPVPIIQCSCSRLLSARCSDGTPLRPRGRGPHIVTISAVGDRVGPRLGHSWSGIFGAELYLEIGNCIPFRTRPANRPACAKGMQSPSPYEEGDQRVAIVRRLVGHRREARGNAPQGSSFRGLKIRMGCQWKEEDALARDAAESS